MALGFHLELLADSNCRPHPYQIFTPLQNIPNPPKTSHTKPLCRNGFARFSCCGLSCPVAFSWCRFFGGSVGFGVGFSWSAYLTLRFSRLCDILFLALPDSSGQPLDGGQLLCPPIFGKEGCPMVTYSELIQIGILIVGIIGLVTNNKKK